MYNWRSMISELQQSDEDCLCFVSHASYLLKTNGILWAVDLRLDKEMHFQADNTIKDDLKQLKYVLLTHLHFDHYDPVLIEAISGADCTWIVPDFMTNVQKEQIRRCFHKFIFVKAGDHLCLDDMEIEVFSSPHSDNFNGKAYSVPEYGYGISLSDHRMIFPGDVRQYEARANINLPAAELFAHVWLGRNAALNYSPQMLDLFCNYFLSMNPKRIFLGHLYDYERTIDNMWTADHALAVQKRMHEMNPTIQVLIPKQGQRIIL